MAKRKRRSGALEVWKDRLERSLIAYRPVLDEMDKREQLYRGSNRLYPLTDESWRVHDGSKAHHIHNIVAENIESMIDSNIPQPKVTARDPRHARLAQIAEKVIRNELERLPMEEINDLVERMVPTQGGAYYYEEWDKDSDSHSRHGEITVRALHPRQVIPQDGVTSSVEDMDYIVVQMPVTKAYVQQRFGVNVDDESESDPSIRSADGYDVSTAEDMLTLNIGFERAEAGINRYFWINDIEIADDQDYRAKRRRRCRVCGEPEPQYQQDLLNDDPVEMSYKEQTAQTMLLLGQTLGIEEAMQPELDHDGPQRQQKKICPKCGGDAFEDSPADYEEIFEPMTTGSGLMIPGAHVSVNSDGKPIQVPTRIPAYKPRTYPLILQKNVSLYGQLLGDSDVDKIASLQNALNWIDKKIDNRLMDAGTLMTLPKDVTKAYIDPKDRKIVRVSSPSDLAMINTYTFTGNDLDYYYAQRAQIYESAREILGITDSFQGRRDTTATSGKAKEFAAAQSAGRLESKRRMKAAAYQELFKRIFFEWLANAEEPRPLIGTDAAGEETHDIFNRYDFLAQDEKSGEYYWIDDFIFGVDSSAPLAQNREAMWQEARSHLESGAMGDPMIFETLIDYWKIMEKLHYPLAGMELESLRQRMQGQQMAMAQQAQLDAELAAQQMALQQPQVSAAMAQPETSGMGI